MKISSNQNNPVLRQNDCNYTLKELLDIPKLQGLLKLLDDIHSMPSAIFDTEGTILTATSWQDICTKFHRVNTDSGKMCLKSDSQISARLGGKGDHLVYRCPMGLVDAAAPIFIEGKHIGNVFTGQLFMEAPDEEFFIKQARQYGFDENEYLTALRKVPLYSEEKLHKNLTFIQSLTQMLAEQGLQHKVQCDAEATLQESEAAFRCLFEDVTDPISLLKDGRFVDTNASLLRMLGYSSKMEFLNCSPSEISPEFQPDGRSSEEKAAEMIATALEKGYHRFEWMHKRTDGSPVPVEVTLTPIIIGGEKMLHTNWRDITERKRIEEALLTLKDTLQEQNEELQLNEESLRDQNDELLATEEMLRVQIEELEISQKLLKQSQEIIQKRIVALTQPLDGGSITFEDLFDIDTMQQIQDEFALATGVASLITHPDGTPITKPSNFTYLCSEIIRKTEMGCANCFKSDAALGCKHNDGPLVQPCLSGGLWDAGSSITVGDRHIGNWLIGQVRDESQSEEKMLEYARSIGADEAEFLDAFRKVPSMSLTRFKHIAQALFTLASQLSTSAYQNVQQARFITERKHTEVALENNNNLLNTLLDAMPIPVFFKNEELSYMGINKTFEQFYGTTRQEMIGKSVYDIFPKELADKYYAQDMELLQQPGQQLYESQISNVQKDEIRDVVFHKATFTDQSGAVRGIVGAILDITEHKKLEQEQQKIEKLESLGVLAGGIAHDFNNILTGIMGNISFAQMFIDADHKSYKPLAEAEKASVRATELSHQLLTFARGGEPIKKVFSVQSLVNETVSMVLHGSNVKGIVDIPGSVFAIEADEGQISQVFHNIIINATQAMPDGGILAISALNEILPQTNPMMLPAGSYIKISFTDQGCGIPDDVAKKIFDPYFTTKPTGNGLGLASVHSIINRHCGYIGVSSIIGKGTTFTIHLPSTGETFSTQQICVGTPTVGEHRGGKILIMDDELVIRDMTSDLLEFMGYTVNTCENGEDTVLQYKKASEAGEPFSAVIMDLTIPGGMGGKETAEQLLAFDTKACLIVSSGYSNDTIMSDYSTYGFKAAIAKPYKIKEFGQLLSVLLQ